MKSSPVGAEQVWELWLRKYHCLKQRLDPLTHLLAHPYILVHCKSMGMIKESKTNEMSHRAVEV